MRKRFDTENRFVSFFDPDSGFYLRTGVLDDNEMDTGIDPFMSSFPELIDVGIMGHCIHGKSGLCIKSGVQCYQDGLHADKPNMTISDFKRIAKECQGRTWQFALGGAGDPDMHESFEDILITCKEYDIVPNFTTSGLGMTREKADLCRQYCGAVAVSWYRSEYTLKAINLLLEAGVKTNIHYVLGKNTIDEAIGLLKSNSFPEGGNAVVFLLHKPVGLGRADNVLTINDGAVAEFFSLIDNGSFPFCKVGFDSCSIPALLNLTKDISLNSIDTCEGARWSMYITSDMIALPCSFDNQEKRWGYDIKNEPIENAWRSRQFEDFRNIFRNACPNCKQQRLCMGGCPIRESIVMCRDRRET